MSIWLLVNIIYFYPYFLTKFHTNNLLFLPITLRPLLPFGKHRFAKSKYFSIRLKYIGQSPTCLLSAQTNLQLDTYDDILKVTWLFSQHENNWTMERVKWKSQLKITTGTNWSGSRVLNKNMRRHLLVRKLILIKRVKYHKISTWKIFSAKIIHLFSSS